MTLKKKFDTPQAARDAMFRFRRAGADSFCKGSICTLIVDACGDALIMFDGWTKVES